MTNDTQLNFLGDCDINTEWEIGWDDAQGYNDAGPLDIINGCTGGHNECPDCSYKDQQPVLAPRPQFFVDQLYQEVYWEYDNYDHSTTECSSDCYQDDNTLMYGGCVCYYNYTCAY